MRRIVFNPQIRFGRDVFYEVEAGVEFEGKAEFLRSEGAGGEARAELLEHVREQEGERLEEHERMFEFGGFFEDERGFEGNECALGCATRELLQANAGLSEALAKCDFRKCGESAQVAHAPEIEKFEQA